MALAAFWPSTLMRWPNCRRLTGRMRRAYKPPPPPLTHRFPFSLLFNEDASSPSFWGLICLGQTTQLDRHAVLRHAPPVESALVDVLPFLLLTILQPPRSRPPFRPLFRPPGRFRRVRADAPRAQGNAAPRGRPVEEEGEEQEGE